MSVRREYFIGRQYFGYGPADPAISHAEVNPAIGQCFFCPICHEVWAKALIVDQPSQVRHRPCERHLPGYRFGTDSLGWVSPHAVAGSLILDEDATWNRSLPEMVWRREFALHVRWAASMLPPDIASIAQSVLPYIYNPPRKE